MEEKTPDRGLRKMIEKLRQIDKRPAGQIPSIMAKRTIHDKKDHLRDPIQKIERSLNDVDNLGFATDALEFLDSLYLFHCWSCDEEWPVFGRSWPEGGAKFIGDKAGKSEVLDKHGFAHTE